MPVSANKLQKFCRTSLLLFLLCGSIHLAGTAPSSPQDPETTQNITIQNLTHENNILIKLPIKAERNINIHIIDMLGRELKDTLCQQLSVPGELKMYAGNLRQGIYIIKVNYQNYQWTKKLLYNP